MEDEFNLVLEAFNKYSPKVSEYINENIDILDNVEKFYDENNLVNYKKLDRVTSLKEKGISDKLVWKHFLVQNLGALLEKLRKSKNTENLGKFG